MSTILIILLSFSLSMDAFSMALLCGMSGLNQKKSALISICVGIFHFLMPIIGCYIGQVIVKIVSVNTSIIIGIIFVFIGCDMLLSIRKKEDISIINGLFSCILLSFAVSIDSFFIGISYGIDNKNILIASIMFSLFSSLFTYIGLLIGKSIYNILGKISIIAGSIILILLGIKYLI